MRGTGSFTGGNAGLKRFLVEFTMLGLGVNNWKALLKCLDPDGCMVLNFIGRGFVLSSEDSAHHQG